MRDLLESGQRQVRDTFAYGNFTAHIFNMISESGPGGVEPSAGEAVVAADLPRIESALMPAGVRRVTLTSAASGLSSSTAIGWVIAVNQGGQANAKVAIDKVIDSTGGNLMSYGGTVTPAAEDDNVVFICVSGDPVTLDFEHDLQDIFIVDIHAAAIKAGTALLNIMLGVPQPVT